MPFLSSIFRINTTTTGGQYDPTVTVLRDGRLAVAWADDSNAGNIDISRDIRARLVNADGSGGADFKVNAEASVTANFDNHFQFAPDITALANGGFAVAWADTLPTTDSSFRNTTVMQRFDRTGATVGDNLTIFPAVTPNGNSVFAAPPSIVGMDNGSVAIVADTSNSEIAPLDPDFKVLLNTVNNAGTVGSSISGSGESLGAQLNPLIAKLTTGNMAIAYLSNEGNASHQYSVRVQIRSQTGVAIGPEVEVPNTNMLNNQGVFEISALDAGRFVVVWAQPVTPDEFNLGLRQDIMAQVYGANGSPVGGIINVHTRDGLAQALPVVAGQPDGSFLIVWQESSGSSGGDFLRGQLFNSDGTPDGAMFSLGIEAGVQSDVDITITQDGRYLVVWEDRSAVEGDADGWAIRGQYVDPRDAAVDWGGTARAEQYVGTDFNDSLSAGGGSDSIWGGAGDDTFAASGGADELHGGAGNDTFVVTATDLVFEDAGGGTDRILAQSSFSLADGAEVEVLQLTNTVTASPRQLRGNDVANQIIGSTQSDMLFGGAGNDTLTGNAGNDTLTAGSGIDRMTGGADADTFVLLRASGSTDTVTDFTHDLDLLQISAASFGAGLVAGPLAGTQFAANRTGLATTADQRFIYETDSGNLFFDSNGSGNGGSILIATLLGRPSLDAGDFTLT